MLSRFIADRAGRQELKTGARSDCAAFMRLCETRVKGLLIAPRRRHMSRAMTQPAGLDDRDHARFAWARFRTIMWAMAATSLAAGFVVVGIVWAIDGPMPWLFIGMIVGGVWATVMMAALLMGLMFLSSGTGHDDQIDDRVSGHVLDDEDQAGTRR